jgi:DNA-binding NarL/FixJ family response regulator
MAVRVFLLDDHELVRRGVAQMLSTHEDLEVVGDAGTADEAVRRGDALRPDVAVLDARLGEDEMDGIESAGRSARARTAATRRCSPAPARRWPAFASQ